jgi:hypothetical protein
MYRCSSVIAASSANSPKTDVQKMLASQLRNLLRVKTTCAQPLFVLVVRSKASCNYLPDTVILTLSKMNVAHTTARTERYPAKITAIYVRIPMVFPCVTLLIYSSDCCENKDCSGFRQLDLPIPLCLKRKLHYSRSRLLY